jgi:enhancing lycopene biosynthesis protein 2
MEAGMPRIPNVAVLLAGCGHVDGAEIRESVFTLLALDQHGARSQCIAPDAPQAEVIDHGTGKAAESETRNILREAGRIARVGKCLDLAKADPAEYDALLLPGGNGVAKNFCTFAKDGASGDVRPDVLKFVSAFFEAGKPVGAICISPALVAMALAKSGRKARLTLGSGEGVAGEMARLGMVHQSRSAREVVIDEEAKLVTTPAYMCADARLSDVWTGIERCCAEVLARV